MRMVDPCLDFVKHYDTFVNQTSNAIRYYGFTHEEEIMAYYSKLLNYTITGGKLSRGKLLVAVARSLAPNMDPDKWAEVLTLGWCVELLQSAFIVADDIMDNGVIRRGKACWHTLPGVGVGNGLNDVLFLNTMIYRYLEEILITRVLSSVIRDRQLLLFVAEFFQEATMVTIVGQTLDSNKGIQDQILGAGTPTFDLFCTIAKNKTGHYSFLLPIQIGMACAGVAPQNLNYIKASCVAMHLGELFQAQDDMLDCFGSSRISGKNGTDIQEKKVTWLLAKALQLGNEAQRAQILDNLGKGNEDSIEAVKRVYRELNLQLEFESYNQQKRQEIAREIQTIDFKDLKSVLEQVLQEMHKRFK